MYTPRTAKNVFSAALCMVIGWVLLSDPAAAAAVVFPDPNLEAVIRHAINKPTGDIDASDLLGITSLHRSSGRGITDLTGLEYCVNLEYLSLNDNQIVELLPLAGLTELGTLILARNHIADLSPLAGLTNLTWLNLDENAIEGIDPLAGLTNLELLELAHNQISDARPLAGISSLYQLNLSYNAIGSASQLDGLVLSGYQCDLLLDNNPLTSFLGSAHVSMLGEYNYFHATFCQLNDLSGVGQFISSSNDLTVELNDNQISDVEPLALVTNLRAAVLCNNPLSSNAAYEQIQALRQMGVYVEYGIDCIGDWSVTDNLTSVGRLEYPFGGALAVMNGLLYATAESYLAIADIYSPSEPLELSMVPISGASVNIAVSGSLACVVSADRVYPSTLGYVQTYDVSNPLFPDLVGTYIDDGEPVSVAACGRYAYVAWKDGDSSAEANSSLRVFDLKDRFSPRQVTCYDVPGTVSDLAIEDCIAYVGHRYQTNPYTDDGPGGVLVLDVTNPRNPKFLGLYESEYGTRALDVSNGILCRLTTGSGWTPLPMEIVDVSSPSSPNHLSYYFTVNGTDVALSRGIAYVASWGLSVYDIRDPQRPVFVGFDHTIGAENVRVVDDVVWASTYYGIALDRYTGSVSDEPQPSGCGCPCEGENEHPGRLECAGADMARGAFPMSLSSDSLLLAAVFAVLSRPKRRGLG
jgi:hypothetical protein